jgi:hypothetical protein
MARGPLSNERLSIDGDGLVVHEFKRPFRDGTTQSAGIAPALPPPAYRQKLEPEPEAIPVAASEMLL